MINYGGGMIFPDRYGIASDEDEREAYERRTKRTQPARPQTRSTCPVDAADFAPASSVQREDDPF